MLRPGRYKIEVYHLPSDKSPFDEWLDELDKKTRARLLDRIKRMESGQFGDYKAIGLHLYELRFFFGPGHRVYFGKHDSSLVVLLLGGDKSTQSRDIAKAEKYWKNYQEEHP